MKNNGHYSIEEYKILTDLYKFYLDIVLKSVTFALGVVGALLAYLFKGANTPLAAYGLIVPSILCLGMGVAFLVSIRKTNELKMAIEHLASELNLTLPPHTGILKSAMLWFGILLILVGFSIILAGLIIDISF